MFSRISLIFFAVLIPSLLTVMGCGHEQGPTSGLQINHGTLVTATDPAAAATVALVNGSTRSFTIYCSGTLIDKNTVLTAAHCVKGQQETTVAMGVGFLDKSNIVVRKGTPTAHADFSTTTDNFTINDIAVIHLNDDGANPPNMVPMKLADTGEFAVGTNVILAGYGILGYDAVVTDRMPTFTPKWNLEQNLYKAESKIESLDASRGYLITYKSDNGLDSACGGDSGGPMFIQEQDGNLALIGVTRGPVPDDDKSKKCAGRGTYTNASYFTPWILSHES